MRFTLTTTSVALVAALACSTPQAPPLSSTAGSTSSGTSTGGSTTAGSSSSSGSSSGTSTGGTTGVSGPFVGTVEVETMTTLTLGTDGGTSRTYLDGFFSQWAACPWPCTVDAGACCLFPVCGPVLGLSAGLLTVSVPLDDGGVAQISIAFDGGAYDSDISLPLSGGLAWVSELSASGDVVPAFDISGSRLQGPAPVLVPDLSELMTLSTSQDWTVPLVPSELEYLFTDRLILVSPDVPSIIVCQTSDEGALNPPLVVSASLLSRFSGHQGTITIYRDDYRGPLDAGILVVDYRVGVGVQTATNAVTFTP